MHTAFLPRCTYGIHIGYKEENSALYFSKYTISLQEHTSMDYREQLNFAEHIYLSSRVL